MTRWLLILSLLIAGLPVSSVCAMGPSIAAAEQADCPMPCDDSAACCCAVDALPTDTSSPAPATPPRAPDSVPAPLVLVQLVFELPQADEDATRPFGFDSPSPRGNTGQPLSPRLCRWLT